MVKISDIPKMYVGSAAVVRCMFGGRQVWPDSYSAVLSAVFTGHGSGYDYGTIPAAGGCATVQWTVNVYRGANRVHQATVTPDSVTISDTSGFSYANGTLTANSRGTNGLGPGGSAAPVSAPARTCTITGASYTFTYDGIQLTATYDGGLAVMQNANGYTASGSASYSGVRIAVGNYTSTATEAPASGGSTSWSVAATGSQPYIFDSGATYAHQYDASSEVLFYALVGWIDTNTGGTLTVDSRGTDAGGRRSAEVYAVIGTTTYDSITLYQALNRVESSVRTDGAVTFSGLSVTWAGSYARSAGETGAVNYTARQAYTTVNTYTSGATATVEGQEDFTPTWSGPDWLSVSGHSITATKRGKSDTVARSSYLYAYNGSTRLGSVYVQQYGTQQAYRLVASSGTVNLPASGGSTAVSFIGWTDYDNGDSSDSTTASVGWRSGGSISGRISRSGSTFTGTDLRTTAYDAVSTEYTAYWSGHSSATATVTVTQEGNAIERTEYGEWAEGTRSYGTPTTETQNASVSASLSDYGSSSPAPKAGGTATLTYSASHQERTATPYTQTPTRTVSYVWTSGHSSAGTPETGTPQSGTEYSAWTTVDDTAGCGFTIDPASMLSVSGTASGSRTVSVAANAGAARDGVIFVYSGYADATVRVYQRAGNASLVASVSSLTFPAGGGTQTFVATAVSTGWTLTTDYSTTYNPFTGATLSPKSGSAGTTTVTVTLTTNIRTTFRRGRIILTPDNADAETVYVSVSQDPPMTS